MGLKPPTPCCLLEPHKPLVRNFGIVKRRRRKKKKRGIRREREKEEEENEPSLIQTLDPPLFRIKHTFSENSFSASLNINEIDY